MWSVVWVPTVVSMTEPKLKARGRRPAPHRGVADAQQKRPPESSLFQITSAEGP
jgi:hypothetical protein